MSVSNFIYGTAPLPPAIGTLPQLREPNRENPLYGQNLFIPDSNEVQLRANKFIKSFDENLNTQEGSKSPLQTLLQHTVQLSTFDEATQEFAEITQAFYKQKGHFMRLFSEESWDEWTENRTALGKVAAQFRYCIQSTAEMNSCVKKLDGRVIQRANEEAEALLKKLNSSTATPMFSRIGSPFNNFNLLHQSSCVKGLIVGTAASLATKNPLPLLMGLSECFPKAFAQEKIGNEFQVNTYITSTKRFPSVASFSNGNFVVTWESWNQDGSGRGVYGQLFDETGSEIGNEFRVNTDTFNDQREPSVASLSNGNFVVTFESVQWDGDLEGVYGQLFYGNGTKIGNDFQVNTFTANGQIRPSVTSFNNGNFVVTWQSELQEGSGDEVYYQLFNEDSSEIGSEVRVNTYTTDNQYEPSVESLINGNFIVTWSSTLQDGSSDGVYGQLFGGTGSKIGNEFRVNTYTNSYQSHSSVASFSNSNFVVTWESGGGQDGSVAGVYGQLFNGNANKIGSEFQVNTYTNDYQISPTVAVLKNDRFVATWSSQNQDGSVYGIYSQLFDESGVKLGNEFQVNTYTNGNQIRSSVASLNNGTFVVIWESSGIYGQIFNDNIPSSTTSTITTTTFSTTSDVSRPTMSIISQPGTSVNPSSSTNTISKTTKTTKTTVGLSREVISTPSNPSNRLLWLWLLLGIAGGTTCIGITGYFLYRSRDRKKDDDVEFELGHKDRIADSKAEMSSQHALPGVTAERDYLHTPNQVTVGNGLPYSHTPNFTTADKDYLRTPDRVTAERDYLHTPNQVTAGKPSGRKPQGDFIVKT